MRILIEILHPAHVHFFRNFAAEMIDSGHDVIVTSRDKDVTLDLLDEYGIEHEVLSIQRTGTPGLVHEQVERVRKLSAIIREQRPDALTGIMGPTIAVAGRLHRVPSIVFYDTEIATATNSWVYRMVDTVVTPECYEKSVPGDHLTYPGYHELAYLHPNHFTPDRARLATFGLDAAEPYAVVRFVSWEASHDRGEQAMSLQAKRRLVEELGKHGRVVISSEGPLPEDLTPLAVSGPKRDIHHVLAFASLYAGESATMASEAAVLGTPALYIADSPRGYINDLERRGLAAAVATGDVAAAIDAARVFRENPIIVATAHAELLRDNVDVTAWMTDFFAGRFG